jgi:hypothetical protein
MAFAVAVPAVVGRSPPGALRVFRLTPAVVDDLLAITVVAVGYTERLDALWLTLMLFASLVMRRPHQPRLAPMASRHHDQPSSRGPAAADDETGRYWSFRPVGGRLVIVRWRWPDATSGATRPGDNFMSARVGRR